MIWPFTGRRRKEPDAFRHLRPGRRYHVVKPFFDHDGLGHPIGESWTFLRSNFLPYDDGLTLHVETAEGAEWTIRMQWRPEAEGPVIEALEDHLSEEPPRMPSLSLRLTRDSVCMADDVDAPHAGLLEVEPDADAVAIARSVMIRNRLAHVGADATWSISLGDEHVVFGLKHGVRFIHPVQPGGSRMRARDIDAVHVRYHAQQDPDETAARLVDRRP